MLCAAFTEVFTDLAMKEDSTQKIGLIINVSFYGLIFFFLGKAWYAFKQTGGLRGDVTI